MRSPERPRADVERADWATQAAETLESVVGSVHDRVVVPAETVARALVYGLVAGAMGVAALVLVTIAGVRALTLVVDEVWIADALLGGVFTAAGLLLWSRRRPQE